MVGRQGEERLEDLGYEIEDVAYDVYKWKREPGKKTRTKVNTGEKKVCRYVQPKREEDGSIKTENTRYYSSYLTIIIGPEKEDA